MKQLKIRSTIGVNLLELLMVITIISVLAAIGYPNYIKFKYETRRSDAKAMIMHIQSTIQNFLIANNTPVLQATDLTTLSFPAKSKSGYYNVSVSISSPNYTITATAIEDQLNDTNCRNIIMTNDGVTSSQNSSAAASTGCW